MRGLFEAVVFLILAAGLHVLLFGLRDAQEGATSAGNEGAALVSLNASNAALVEMVEEWETPPEPIETPASPPPEPEPPQVLPTPPTLSDPAISRPDAAALAMPDPTDLPQVGDQALPPPPAREPAPSQETEMPAPSELAPQSVEAPEPRRDPPKVAPKRQPAPQPAASLPPQRASGSGGGPAAGQARANSAATASQAEIQSLRATWGAALRAQIERRKRYPRAAGGASGTVTVRFTIARSGALQSVAVAGSSGNPELDQAALAAVQSARFPPAPNGLTDASYTFSLPMSFGG